MQVIKKDRIPAVFCCCHCTNSQEPHPLTLSRAFKRTRVFQQTHQIAYISTTEFFSQTRVSRRAALLMKNAAFFHHVEPALLRQTMRSVPGAVSPPVGSYFLVAKIHR